MSKTSRRQYVHRVAWGMVAATTGLSATASSLLLFPRVRFREPSEVFVGRPEDYRDGEVSERFRQSHKLVVVRDDAEIYALSAVCTHLGCITRWQAGQDKFKCFCHGSGFHRSGEQFEGPAPRPLERLDIRLDDEGRLVVDTAVRYRGERGEWSRPGALVTLGEDAAGAKAKGDGEAREGDDG